MHLSKGTIPSQVYHNKRVELGIKMNIVERYRRTAYSQVMLVLLALIVLMISCSEGLTLRTFLNGYVREDARSGLVAGVPSSPQNNLQPVYPAPATQQKQYVSQSSGLSGGYKSVITVNVRIR